MPKGQSSYQNKYTPEMIQWVRDNAWGRTRRELVEMFSFYWGTPMTEGRIKGICNRYKISNGRDGRFKKGQSSHNKGQKMPPEVYERAKATMFKKGHKPANWRPIGSTRVNVDGYVEIKVAEPKKWMQLHRKNWIDTYGPVPKGYKITFKDGNRQNCDIENLMLISEGAHSRMNVLGRRSSNPDVTEAYIALTELEVELSRKKKEKNNDSKRLSDAG